MRQSAIAAGPSSGVFQDKGKGGVRSWRRLHSQPTALAARQGIVGLRGGGELIPAGLDRYVFPPTPVKPEPLPGSFADHSLQLKIDAVG